MLSHHRHIAVLAKMSQAGPFGPGNPPPPPPGPPPGAAYQNRIRYCVTESAQPQEQSSQAPKAERPYSKLNNKQRKARNAAKYQAREEAENGQRQGRSPFRGPGDDIQLRGVEQSDYRVNQVQHDSRQPRDEARQATPSQALVETYGRLSPVMSIRGRHEQARRDEFCGPVSHNGRPDERSWSPHTSSGEHTRHASQGRSSWDNFNQSSSERSDGHDEGELLCEEQ
jgi:hypothetical protein